ncbi:hypothetical protein UFOVP45_139 [uncultured Caudovirales phage]|uniref:HNHc domain containing protein n=1 Tax=uncultured Caudovirales phage TaxID=2100421 RepID=A0A6J5KP51_9CAUD|nr:hypothetical protein UFOVP45_139 [uncultured Caudovirales phage]
MTDKSDMIIKLRLEGKTYIEIQELTGASKGTISHHVGKGQKDKTRERRIRYRKDIKEHIRDVKECNPCVDCGKFFNYYVMQFDHLPQFEKKFNLARFHSHTLDLDIVNEEISKCDLVCANCHAERTHIRRIELEGNSDEIPDDELK